MKAALARRDFLRCGLGVLGTLPWLSKLSFGKTRRSARPLPAKTVAEIRSHKGAPTLFLNGQPHPAFSYMTYGPEPSNFSDFYKAGVDLYSFAANADSLRLWGMKEVWKGPDEFDYSGEDEMFEMVLSQAPESYIFPRVHTICPRWWLKQNPDHVLSYTDGNGKRVAALWAHRSGYEFPSLASAPALEMSKEALRRYIEHVRNSPYARNTIGYHVCSWAVGEWMTFCVDSSIPMTERFRQFL